MKQSNGWHLAAAALVAASLLASVADAQGPGGGRRGGRGGFGGGMDSTMLLMSEQVQKELELADEQKAEIKKISDEMRESARASFQGLRDLGEEERRAKFAEMREKAEASRAEVQKKVDEILLPEQRERLSQISLQVQGDAAVTSDEVAGKIGLSDEQKQKIEAVRDAAREKMRAAFGQRGEGGDGANRREEMTKLRADTQAQVEAILTDEQKQKLTELKGKPFELDRSQFRGGQGGRRGDGAGGEGRRGRRGEGRNRPEGET